MKDVESIIARMRRATGASSDRELAKLLELKSSGAISLWKRRGRVPLSKLQNIARMESVSVDWLLSGRGDMHAGSSQSLQTIAEQADQYLGECDSDIGGLSPLETGVIRMLRAMPDDRQRKVIDLLTLLYIDHQDQKET